MELEQKMLECGQLNLLGKGKMLPWDNSMQTQFEMWKQYYADGTIEKLMKLCKTDKVYGLFCYHCDMNSKTFSYHIVCENPTFIKNDEYEEFVLFPSQYATFKVSGNDVDNKHIIYNELCDEIWNEWLPKSGYVSLIEPETKGCEEGYASIELYHPISPMVSPYEIEIWLPVEKI